MRPGLKPNITLSVKLENDPMYYRMPRKSDGNSEPVNAGPGDHVTFEANPINDNSSQIIGSVDKVEAAQATVATVGQAASAAPAGQGTAREASIHYQSSRRDALQFLDIATRLGAVKLPVKEAAKLEALEALADHYCAAYFADVATFGAVARANGTDEAADTTAPAGDDAE